MKAIQRFNGEIFYLADAGTKSWMNALAGGFRSRNVKARVVPDLDVKGDYCLYINDNPNRWRGINGAPTYNVNPFFMWRTPTIGKRGVTEGRADIHYITRSGRVIPARDMGAIVHRVSPSGRTTKSARLSDRKPGNIPKDGTTRQKVTTYVYDNEGRALGNRKRVVFIDSPKFGHLKDGRQVVKMGSNWYV